MQLFSSYDLTKNALLYEKRAHKTLIKSTPWVDFINIRTRLSHLHMMRRFFCAQIGQAVNSVWQISAQKFGLNFVGEIEWQFFSPNAVRWHLFAWSNKFGEIYPLWTNILFKPNSKHFNLQNQNPDSQINKNSFFCKMLIIEILNK